MGKKITTAHQESFLQFFCQTKALVENFYFTGGTALAKFYLRHRFSEDLDFFSEREFQAREISPFLRQGKRGMGFQKIDYQQSFNRNIFQLIFSSRQFLKVEFTYFPFTQIEKPKKKEGILVDSLIDIAANKVFAIAQNPRGRDFFDLYWIMEKKKFKIKDLLQKAKIKFDWHIDPLQFASQLLKAGELKDDPILVRQKPNWREVERFFEKMSQGFEKEILKKENPLS